MAKRIKVWFAVDHKDIYVPGSFFFNKPVRENRLTGGEAWGWWADPTGKDGVEILEELWPKLLSWKDEPKPYWLTLEEASDNES
jgi:hypothetical protein